MISIKTKSGMHSLVQFVDYLKKYPPFISDLLHLLQLDVSPDGLTKIKEYFGNLDLTSSFIPQFGLHKGYLKYQSTIEEIISDSPMYSIEKLTLDRNFMDEENVRNRYTKSAESYDNVLNHYWPYGRAETIQSLDLKLGEKILEVGVGTGLNLQYYPDFCQIVGIDMTEEMLNNARRKVEELDKRNVTVHLMNAQKMNFPDSTFNKALAFYAFCAMGDPVKGLQELSRVCNPGAKILIFDVVKSPIDEVATIQLLTRPINRELDHVYIEDFPVYSVPFDSCMDMPSLLKNTKINLDRIDYFTTIQWVALLSCTNKK
jgi:phosphatidylethanolamine/phosphatidyl-N-methylethanolamine N-methyltransferase